MTISTLGGRTTTTYSRPAAPCVLADGHVRPSCRRAGRVGSMGDVAPRELVLQLDNQEGAQRALDGRHDELHLGAQRARQEQKYAQGELTPVGGNARWTVHGSVVNRR